MIDPGMGDVARWYAGTISDRIEQPNYQTPPIALRPGGLRRRGDEYPLF
jgi:hypothetical protein